MLDNLNNTEESKEQKIKPSINLEHYKINGSWYVHTKFTFPSMVNHVDKKDKDSEVVTNCNQLKKDDSKSEIGKDIKTKSSCSCILI